MRDMKRRPSPSPMSYDRPTFGESSESELERRVAAAVQGALSSADDDSRVVVINLTVNYGYSVHGAVNVGEGNQVSNRD